MHSGEDEASLDALVAIASTLGSVSIATEARDLAARVSEGRFYLACVGQFKRGKSTLLDALLGESVLPIGVVPVTSVPTIVRYGVKRCARVRLGNSAWLQIALESVEDYVSEAENPGNAKNVSAIEVFIPNRLLADGMCFVDTPGIESVFEANTRATHEFVPRIDAALIVLGADPPVSGAEVALIKQICGHVDSLLFVMNKVDRVPTEEVKAAKQFARRILAAKLQRQVDVYEVSARSELETAAAGWEWPPFLAALRQMASQSGRALAQRVQRGAAERLVKRLSRLAEDRRDALLTPLEESEARLTALRVYIDGLRQSILDLGQLLKGEQERSDHAIAARTEEFLATSVPEVQRLLGDRLSASAEQGARFRRRAMNVALEVARQQLMPWLEREERIVETEYSHTIARFNSIVDDYLRRLAGTGVPQLEHLADTSVESGRLTAPSRFYFHELLHIGQPASPFRLLGDLILGTFRHRDPIRLDANQFLTSLMETNASRVAADLNHRLGVARRELEITIRRRLDEVKDAAEEVLNHAREVTAAGNEAVESELAVLRRALLDLCDLP